MIRIQQNGAGYEIEGAFKIYGTKDQLLKMSQQIREGALHGGRSGKGIEVGWVDLDPAAVIVTNTMQPWKDTGG